MTTPFVHQFVPGSGGRTLLLLHGTGGDEHSLLPLGRHLAPGAALLAPRGRVLEGRMPRFFRRLAEGVFDQEDLALRTAELGTFVEWAAGAYGFPLAGVTAAGYSNGANIASSLLLTRPGLLRQAVLFRGMTPFVPSGRPDLTGARVRLVAGRHDPIVPSDDVTRLASIFTGAGARAELDWRDAGHELTSEELVDARAWLEEGL